MIYFVRHGQTNYNKKHLIQGTVNSCLNKTGIEQANNHAENLKEIKFDYIFCSPLKRTIQTAEIINQYHHLPILLDYRLIETYMGDLQGKSNKNLDYDSIYKNHHNYGVETREFTYLKVQNFIDYLNKNYKNKNILIVSHSGIYNMFNLIMNHKNINEFINERFKNNQLQIFNN